MDRFRKPIITYLSVLALLPLSGCGWGGGEAAPTAAIEGPEAEKAPSAASADAATAQQVRSRLHPVVLVETTMGNITLELDAEKAPLTVDNFLAYVDSGHFAQTIFHQVLKNYPSVIIGGAYATDGTEKKPMTPVRNEAHNGLKNTRGAVAMARQPDVVDSATCHFFINLADNDVLDHKDRTLESYGFCVFGRVVAGLEVAEKIGATEVHDTEQFSQIPVTPVVIKSIRRVKS
jgi:cyclophilin family peptidyl-prolyl cis-trans isomerase